MLARRGKLIEEGDLVICFHGVNDLRSIIVTRGAEVQCKAGRFPHDNMIGRRFGSRIPGISNSRAERDLTPHLLVLQPSANLWTMVVPHRTQIIYETDISVIIMMLRLRPGCIVAEAGTGSGSLTHSLAKAVAPHGKVHTFDFHRARAEEAKAEFSRSGLSDIIISGWRDICTTPADVLKALKKEPTDLETETQDKAISIEEHPENGFGLPENSVDAIFLDVPAPWQAIDNVLYTLRSGCMLCTFSPCIEQTQRTCDALRACGKFIDIKTVEALTKEFKPMYKSDITSSFAHAEAGAKRDREDIYLRPSTVSKGHSAYLTFARRRLIFEKDE